MAQSCKWCGSGNLVWNWSDGDVICRGCGTVVEAHLMDDHVPFKESGDYGVERLPVSTRCVDRVRMVDAVEPELVINIAGNIKSSKKEDVVAGVYNATKGFTVGDLCSRMKVKPKRVWTALGKLGVEACGGGQLQRGMDILKRIVYECELIESGRSWEVIKTSRKMLEKVCETGTAIQGVNMEKFVKSLLVVATDVCGICQRREVMKVLGVNATTLKKHETIIQRGLST
jgi:transcription initiation factor TFIIIB Brf1 subunit/transcription initiation factor TFIIB